MSYEKLEVGSLDRQAFRRHRVTDTGDFFTVTELTRPKCGEAVIRKLDAGHYLYVPDGEVREYARKAETRDQSIKSLRRTMHHIRDLVNANVRQDNSRNVLWVTLTYGDRAVKGREGAERVAHDFDIFFKRFRRYSLARGHKPPAYITVLEPQRDGVWHLHCLFIYQHRRPFVPNEELSRMWGQGYTKTQKLPHANMGAYLSAYLTDAALDELSADDLAHGARQREIKEVEVGGEKKKFVKGARLYYYPSECNIIRHSRNLIYPETWDVTVAEMELLQQGGELMFETAGKFTDEATGFELVVTRRIYQKRRRSRAA